MWIGYMWLALFYRGLEMVKNWKLFKNFVKFSWAEMKVILMAFSSSHHDLLIRKMDIFRRLKAILASIRASKYFHLHFYTFDSHGKIEIMNKQEY